MKRAFIYCRCSTTQQDLSTQLFDLRKYAEARGLTIIEEFQDFGISGTREKRPALDKMMDAIRKRKTDVVLVWRFDRFARSTRHLVQALHDFRSCGVDFISYQENIDTSSAMGECIFTILSSISQLERDIIVSRVKAGLQNAVRKGRTLGRPKLCHDKSILDLRTQGLSIRAIASKLNISKGSVQNALKH